MTLKNILIPLGAFVINYFLKSSGVSYLIVINPLVIYAMIQLYQKKEINIFRIIFLFILSDILLFNEIGVQPTIFFMACLVGGFIQNRIFPIRLRNDFGHILVNYFLISLVLYYQSYALVIWATIVNGFLHILISLSVKKVDWKYT